MTKPGIDLENNDKEFWYPLDNAAKIYPAVTTDEVTSVYRITVVLKERINIKNLFKAVRIIEPRFPYYKVVLKKGFFWYYLESVDFRTHVRVDDRMPCRRFRDGGHLFRILVKENKLSVEFSHLLADGGGAYEYLTTLLLKYFELIGIEAPSDFKYHKVDEPVDPEEFEDSYNRFFQENIPANASRPKAFHLPFPLRSKPRLDVIHAVVSSSQVKEKAKEKGVNVTIYLVAVYLAVLQDIFNSLPKRSRYKRHKKIAVEVPVNLRNMYQSATMRNFSLFVIPELDLRLGYYTFDEIINTINHQMQLETDKKLINKILAMNVGSERKLLVRSIPLFLKSFVLRLYYYSFGSTQYSGLLTNLGNKSFPESITQHIEHLSLTPPPPNKLIKVGCGVISFNDRMVLTFGNITKSRELERRFMRFLVKEGINVRITNNC